MSDQGNLPPAVRAQLDAATAGLTAASPAAVSAAVSEAPAAPTAAEAPPAPAPVAVPAPTPEPQASDALWEQRFRSFQGHANAELQRKDQAIAEMQAQLAALAAKLEAATKAPEPTPEPGVTDADVETFGADQVRFVERVARAVAREVLVGAMSVHDAKFKAVFDRLQGFETQVGSVDQRVQLTAEQQFFKDLTDKVPGWQQVNAAPAWLNWLQTVEPYTGATWQTLLDHNRAQLDVDRVVKIFQAFLAQAPTGQATSAPQAQAQTGQAPPAAQPNPLAGQVSPPKSRTADAPPGAPAAETRIWKQAEIDEFFGLVARGRVDAATAKATEAAIFKAAAEGRVQ